MGAKVPLNHSISNPGIKKRHSSHLFAFFIFLFMPVRRALISVPCVCAEQGLFFLLLIGAAIIKMLPERISEKPAAHIQSSLPDLISENAQSGKNCS